MSVLKDFEAGKNKSGQGVPVDIDEMGLTGLSALLTVSPNIPSLQGEPVQGERRNGQDRRASDRRTTAPEFKVTEDS
jgi:hypothetical protein